MSSRLRIQEEGQGQIKLGTRVIRGPDWNHEWEDNGEGFLGTIVEFNVHKRQIRVIWDSGRSGQYRADPGEYDLRMVDNAPTGELHNGTMCHYCSDSPIHGMKWTCIQCNIDMCTPCYMNDKHDKAHGFERTDTLESRRYNIRPRNSVKEQVVLKGIFEGAEVVAGPYSMHDFETDGGDVGYVQEITSWQNKFHRGIVSVFWKASNRIQFYRLGAEGCVDVYCSRLTETATGGTCYVDNLPVIGNILDNECDNSAYFNKISTETPDLVPRNSDGYFDWQLKYQQKTRIPSTDSTRNEEMGLPGPLNEDNETLKGLTSEFKELDTKYMEVFFDLLGEDSYPHFESRVMLFGEPGTGRTSIARYLVGRQPSRLRRHTEGIKVYSGLAYMNLETKEWLNEQQDFSLEEITVSRSLLQEDKRTKNVKLPHTTPTIVDVLDRLVFDEKNADEFSIENSQVEHIDPTGNENTDASNDRDICETPLDEDKQMDDVDQAFTKSKENTDASNDREICETSLDEDKQMDDVDQAFTKSKENTDASSGREICEASLYEDKPMDVLDQARSKLEFTSDKLIETISYPGLITKLKFFFGVSKEVKELKVSITKEKFLKKCMKVGKKKLYSRNIAPMIIWDIGGQDVFCLVYQTYLTDRAIYILVLDGSRSLDDPSPYEQYIPGKISHKTARDYLWFWINTIVTNCRGSIQGFPKIMVVVTHKDRVKSNEVEYTRNALFTEIRILFGQTPLMQHLIIDDEIFVNAKDSLDPEMARIKRVIIRESEQQPTWGESLPKCFIPLELEFASLIRQNIHVITIEHLRKTNYLQSIRPLSETELKVFLTFQHSIGKVLYFGETKMDKHVILSPTYLIDAFNSIITDRRLDKGDTEREEIWDAMGKSGVLSKKVIQTIWSRKKYWKFCKDKDYLLDVMTHLDILVVPKRYDTDHNRIPTDFYYVPSMLRASDDTGYLKSPSFTQRSIAIAFQSTSFMIPPALSFRFISYCISVWPVKTYGEANRDMLFHRSGVFTIDPSLDMYILCEDDKITARLVHARRNELIPRDMASSINECLTSSLEKISQMYVRTSSNWTQTSDTSFITRICCSSPDNPCVLPVNGLVNTDELWICPTHGIQHSMHTIESWFPRKDEETCELGCPVTDDDFLSVTPSDLHLRRLSLLFSNTDVRRIALHLGLSSQELTDNILETDPRKWNFKLLRNCRDSLLVTFKQIKQAVEAIDQGNIHKLCKIFKGKAIEFEINSDKWDMVPTYEHIDRLAPLVGNNSLPFLIELGMEFQTWEQITHRQNERDLVRLNTAILEEWRFKFCRMHNLKPTLRTIAQAFSNIGKSVEIVVQTLSDFF